MKLKNIVKSLNILDSNVDFEVEISKITSDSRKISYGDAFVAIKGTKRDGNLYINDAIKNGAVVVITENKEYCSNKIPYVLVDDARKSLSLILVLCFII